MSMKDSMSNWMKKHDTEVDADAIKRTCDAFNLAGDDYDACILLVTSFDRDQITDVQLVAGLIGITNKPMEFVEQTMRGLAIAEKLGVKYNGIQEADATGAFGAFLLTDKQTGSTFGCTDTASCQKTLEEMRTKGAFPKPVVPELELTQGPNMPTLDNIEFKEI